ncbi:hypothetical protein BBJ28_00014835 [Nothophytophthora sp. Chile5]|nr:hypothetical protein BBJ28_00014835 [Nothophytophthora sp. Chile5]
MKTCFLTALALVNAAALASAADCDMNTIESMLYPNATQGLADCQNATGIDIFAVNTFPTTEQVTTLSENVDCADYLNQINQVANAEIQCNITVEGVTVTFGTLIADFLTGKTGNESDSGSGSVELPSSSASGSVASGSAELDSSAATSGSSAPSAAGSNAASGATALSFVAYGTMKTSFLTTLALVNVAAGLAVATAPCNMDAIKEKLPSNMTTVQTKCESSTGIGIFNMTSFPTKAEVTLLHHNTDCSMFINAVNTRANSEIDCNVTVDGVSTNYRTLINKFLSGHTGNESDSGSGSVEFPSESDSGSATGNTPTPTPSTTATVTSGSAASVLSFVAYGAVAAIALALH